MTWPNCLRTRRKSSTKRTTRSTRRSTSTARHSSTRQTTSSRRPRSGSRTSKSFTFSRAGSDPSGSSPEMQPSLLIISIYCITSFHCMKVARISRVPLHLAMRASHIHTNFYQRARSASLVKGSQFSSRRGKMYGRFWHPGKILCKL